MSKEDGRYAILVHSNGRGGRRHRRAKKCQPPPDRTGAEQRSHCRPWFRLPAGARGGDGTRGPVRHHDADRDRAGRADRRRRRGARCGADRGAGRLLMPSLRTLPEALRDAAAGGHGCLFIGGGSSGLHRDVYRSYADLHAAALGVSRSLRVLGLRRGDVVALVVDDAESFLMALYGASMAGLLPASLHPPANTRDLGSYYELTARVLRSSGARALVTSARLVEGFKDIRAACPGLATVVTCSELMD